MSGLEEAASRLDDRHGRGGKTRLARALGWDYSTLWRKLNGRSKITESDLLAAEAVVEKFADGSSG